MFCFFNDTATTEIYTLSLHDALPIYQPPRPEPGGRPAARPGRVAGGDPGRHADRRGGRLHDPQRPREGGPHGHPRSEEHTSELQSRQYLVCRLLLEKKKQTNTRLMT